MYLISPILRGGKIPMNFILRFLRKPSIQLIGVSVFSSVGISSKKSSMPSLEAAEKDEAAQVNSSSIFSWILENAPCFPVRGEQVVILHDPLEFYNKLIDYARNVKTRVKISSLYIGNGEKELALLEILQNSMIHNVGLRIHILMDGFRGSRSSSSSRKFLIPNRIYPLFQVYLYFTPRMKVWNKKLLPERLNEIVGLQHMKVYIFDDDVIITGANFSHDYFTNRQDRYIVIKGCQQLADFYSDLIDELQKYCALLTEHDELVRSSAYNIDPNAESDRYITKFRNAMIKLYNCYIHKGNHAISECDTWICPLLEMPPFDIHFDSMVTKRILSSVPKGSTVHLGTGYFNLTKQYADIIVKQSKAAFIFLIAHPLANGFSKANGISGYIPSVYTALAEQFLVKVNRYKAEQRISMEEYYRDGWTYHAKGLWLTLPGQTLPDMTIVGSSNFGDRSVSRDLETQCVIITKNEELKSRLDVERKRLFNYGQPVTLDILREQGRNSSRILHYMISFFKSFF